MTETRVWSALCFSLLVACGDPADGASSGRGGGSREEAPVGGAEGDDDPVFGMEPGPVDATESPPAGGAAGVSQPAGPRDQSISFDWPEDTGASGPPCRAGNYAGEFEGVYTSPATVIGLPLEVRGKVEFTLFESQQGEFFDIQDGHVTGVASTGEDDGDDDDDGIPFRADIVGTLNCATGALENAGLQNGSYDVLFLVGRFEGPVTGIYDRPTSSFVNGTWSVIEVGAAPQFGGSGTWNAQWVP